MNNELVDQTPPQNIEAEQAVLGAVFVNPDALVEAQEFITADDFYRRAHQIIFQAMADLNDAGEGIDPITLKNQLEKQDQLENIGGISYLADLAVAVPTAANVSYYAKIVQEKAVLRRLIKAATKIVTDSYQQDGDLTALLDDAEQGIMHVSE